MGFVFSKLLALIWEQFHESPKRITLVGISGAGKTTILYKLKLNKTVAVIPTIGFNVETVGPCKGLTLTIWDVGGGDKLRPLIIRHYCGVLDNFIFVVDSTDEGSFPEARDFLSKAIEANQAPFLVLANKQDLPEAASVSKITEALSLNHLQPKYLWHVQGCSATTGEGLMEGLTIFSGMIKNVQKEV